MRTKKEIEEKQEIKELKKHKHLPTGEAVIEL